MACRQALFKRYYFLPDNIPKNIPTMDNTSIRVADDFDLASIKSPADIKRLTVDELQVLADRLRVPLTEKLGRHGGHVGPNLGFMEATIALHYVFDAPVDKLVFDVSHQTYPHKMLTGRIQAFLDPAHYDDVTGYTSPKESPYDLFSVGHTSTSVALAAGLAKARDLRGGKENVVAIIGDGSLSGGEAFEGLDYAATLGTNFIVVVNDNQMSIAPNHGGIYENLRLLRDTDGTAQCNLFKAMGFRYLYVPYGNDVASLVKAFEAVKNSDTPVVVHIDTMKGKGLPVAERNKEKFHYSMPFDPKTGELLKPVHPRMYEDLFATHMLDRMANDPKVCTITAGTPGAIAFGPDRREAAGSQFIDVGIAEQCATGLASGLAKGRTPGVRRGGHIPPARLRPARAGRGHQLHRSGVRHLQRERMGHTRRDTPRILLRPDDGHNSRPPHPRAHQCRRIHRHARLGYRPDRDACYDNRSRSAGRSGHHRSSRRLY